MNLDNRLPYRVNPYIPCKYVQFPYMPVQRIIYLRYLSLVYCISTGLSQLEKKEGNPLQEGMWRTSGPQRVYNPMGGRGTKGLPPGSAFVTSRQR